MNRKNLFIIGSGLSLLIAVVFALLGGFPAVAEDVTGVGGIPVAPERGALAPDFSLRDLQGKLVTLGDFRGQTVLINFWATWCGPCRIEMPTLQKKYEQFSPELAILAVDFDEPEEQVASFSTELGLTFDILLDPGATVQSLYRVRGYPTTVFVSPDGVIELIHIGIMTESQLDGYFVDLGLTQ